jgi:hypothetical protein
MLTAMTAPAIMSRRAYARARGVSHPAIMQAIREGRLPLGPDGNIDVELADRTWYQRHQQSHQGRQHAADAEARRERALLQSTVAKIQMTRRKTALLRARLVERDKEQAAISRLLSQLNKGLLALRSDPDPLIREAAELILTDLGDLHAEARKVTRAEDTVQRAG